MSPFLFYFKNKVVTVQQCWKLSLAFKQGSNNFTLVLEELPSIRFKDNEKNEWVFIYIDHLH